MSFEGSKAGQDKHTGYTFRGKEIILTKSSAPNPTGLVAKGMERGIFPDEKKIEVVTIFAATGNYAKTAELTKVPEANIRNWRKQQWFQEYMQEIRNENQDKIDAKFTSIAEKALEQLSDRLEHGDFHVTRDGDVIRKPISGKDLSLITAINIDKRQLLRGEPTSRSASTDGTAPVVDKLEKLAETFSNLAKFGRPKTEIIDVTPEKVDGQPQQ